MICRCGSEDVLPSGYCDDCNDEVEGQKILDADVPQVITRQLIRELKCKGLTMEATSLLQKYYEDKARASAEGRKEQDRIMYRINNHKRRAKKNGN